MAELFTAETLAALVGRPVSAETGAAIHTWTLAAILGEIGELPDPVPPDVTAVALEVAKAAVPTPGGAASTTIGPYAATYTDSGGPQGMDLSREQRIRLRKAAGLGAAFSVGTGSAILDVP
ncbi:hypothetical protein [Saccharopolyspora spinosa]|uniref:Gp19/Gp15/Gp42-like protein n=1 Tax=Saccharopolyspora spinosa TaxID=60894 RepID=A0A2N3XZ84_SACSN|nr:hypothetical protein [Saccharopolyspora spinosa]PKW15931.1 hypothetical protein A8926_3713 [Saccharopolyspora spinosa]